MEEIYNIIDYYSRNNMLLDKKAILAIIKILFIDNNIDNNYKVKVYNKFFLMNKKNVLASFDYESIRVYASRLKSVIGNENNERKTVFLLEEKLNNYENYIFKNTYILQIIMHEMEHLLQYEGKIDYYKQIEKDFMYIEKNFVLSIIKLLKVKNVSKRIRKAQFNTLKQIYDDNYDLSFIERITEIYSLEKTHSLLETYYKDHENLVNLNELLLLNAKMRSYKNEHDRPTEHFFSNIGRLDDFYNIDTDNLTDDESFRYGLKINSKDYINNKELLTLTKKRK